MQTSSQLVRLVSMAGLLASIFRAAGAFHTWDVNEIYSNADGSVQFIELREAQGLDFQDQLAGHTITCTCANGTRTFTFPSNLPSTSTAGRFLVIGTSNLVSMPGGLKPDYVFTNSQPFLSLAGGTLNFANWDVIAYTNIPTDGAGAMIRSGGSLVAVSTNQPRNFSGAFNSLVPLRFLSIGQAGSDVVVSFNTATGTNNSPGPNYTVLATSALGAGWGTLTNITGNGAVHHLTNTIGSEPAQFFHLRVP